MLRLEVRPSAPLRAGRVVISGPFVQKAILRASEWLGGI